jgi:O-antigen ligase
MVLLLLADIALSVTYAGNISRAIQVLAFMALMVLAYFTAKALINERLDIERVLKGIIYGAMVVAVLGAFQFLGDSVGLPNSVTLLKEGYDSSTFGFARVQGASQEPLYFANYIFIPLLILVVLLIDGKLREVLPKWLGILLIVLLGLNFVLAISRGAFLAAGAIGLILIITKYKKLLTLKVIIPAAGILMVVATGVYLGLLRSEPRAIDEFVGHLFVNDRVVGESVVSRLNAIDKAKELFLANPIFGVGIGNYGPSTQHEFDADGKPIGGWFIVNNEYLELLAEVGILGFLIFVTLIIAVTYYAIKAIRSRSGSFVSSSLEGSLFALYAILFQYMTFSTLYIFHLWFLIAFIAGQSAYLLSGKNKTYEN